LTIKDPKSIRGSKAEDGANFFTKSSTTTLRRNIFTLQQTRHAKRVGADMSEENFPTVNNPVLPAPVYRPGLKITSSRLMYAKWELRALRITFLHKKRRGQNQ
jgi:hypothetical protein